MTTSRKGMRASSVKQWVLAVLLGLLIMPAPAFAQESKGESVDPDAVNSDPWRPTDDTIPAMTFAIGDWTTQVTGYIRTAFVAVGLEGDERPDFIGENNGFVMFDARLAVVVRYLEKFEVKLEMDGAADSREDVNSVTGQQVVTLKDAYGAYKPGTWLHILVGQYKPPTDLETIMSTRQLLFIRRSIVNEGIRSGEGVETTANSGLGAQREVGLNFMSDLIELGPTALRYHVAMTNGNSALETRNDNSLFAYYGRLEFHLLNQLLGDYAPGSFLVLGGGANYNERTVGDATSRLNTEDLQWSADLQLNLYGVSVMGEVVGRTRNYPDTAQDAEDTMGIVAQAMYRYAFDTLAVYGGYRYARYDPIVTDDETNLVGQDDLLQYHTIGFGYDRLDLPITGKINYTFTVEEGDSSIDNDILEILFQFSW